MFRNQKIITSFVLLFLWVLLPAHCYSASTCGALFNNSKTHVPYLIAKKNKILKLAIEVPFVVIASSFVWHQIDQRFYVPKAETAMVSQAFNETNKNAGFYDWLIKNDYRFRDVDESSFDVKASLKDQRLKSFMVQKRIRAYNLGRDYESYYKEISLITDPEKLSLEEDIQKFGSDPLFKRLNYFFKYLQQYKKPVADQKKKELFNLTHEMYRKYLMTEVMFYGKNLSEFLEQNSEARELYNDPYVQRLLSLYSEDKISKTQLVYFVQEDIEHVYYFSIFDTLQIDEPAKLKDLRNERLSMIK